MLEVTSGHTQPAEAEVLLHPQPGARLSVDFGTRGWVTSEQISLSFTKGKKMKLPKKYWSYRWFPVFIQSVLTIRPKETQVT